MSEFGYRNLDAWQAGMSSAISIPLNIAEGARRRSRRVFANHVAIALGSHAELETCIELARRLGYLGESEAVKLNADCARAGQLLSGPEPRAATLYW